MIFAVCLISTVFECSKDDNYKITDIYKDLRNRAINEKPSEIKLVKQNDETVYGILMETGYPKAIVSLVAFGEGSVSLYFSNGGGLIGIGQHEKANRLCLELIKSANSYLSLSSPTTKFDLPSEGQTVFYFLTYDGPKKYIEREEVLGNGKSDLSPLFYKAQELITEARLIEEKKDKIE